MIKKKLIHFNTYSAFEESKSQLYDWTIAFIKETKQIYTHQTFYDCDIEDINELNDKIDEILADIYVDVEVDATNGIYIQATDGLLYTEADWDGTKTPNGIAVITDNCRFVMALTDAHTSYCQWGGYGTEVSSIVTTTDESTAMTDYDGDLNTTAILGQLGDSSSAAPAAYYCHSYTFPDDSTGYLGAAGEWQAVLDNKDAITSALSKCGGTSMNSYYWTSTQYSSILSWFMYWNDEDLNNDRKFSHYYVRAFSLLSNATIIGKQSLKDKLDELETRVDDITASAGDTTHPVYIRNGKALACNAYAGGTNVTLNGSNRGGSTASFYAPTSVTNKGAMWYGTGSGLSSISIPTTSQSNKQYEKRYLTTQLKYEGGSSYVAPHWDIIAAPTSYPSYRGSIPYVNQESSSSLAGSMNWIYPGETGTVLTSTGENSKPSWSTLTQNIQAVDTTESVDDPNITYLTTSQQSLTSTELEQVQSNLGIDEKQDIITKTDVAGGDIVETISPNKYYVWHGPTSLSITLGSETSPYEYNEYMFEIICGDTAPTVTLPDTIRWVSEPVIEANKTYQVSIVNNIGVIASV